MMHKQVLHKALLMGWMGATAVALPAVAGDWTFSPRVSGSETVSDNIDLDSSGSEELDLVTEISPGIGVRGRGRRVQLDFDYQASLLHYARSTSSRELQHRLQASGRAEIVEDIFFVDVRSTVSQRNQSSSGRRATDNISVSANREQAVTFGISPSIRKRLGPFADVVLTYDRDQVDNSNSVGSTLDGLTLAVSSGRKFTKLPWQIRATARREDNDSGSTSTFRRVNTAVTHAFSRRYSVRLEGGFESNDLVGRNDNGSAPTWRVTGIWTPTPRTNFEFGYGGESFGNSFSLNASHRMRRAVFSASYRESLTSSSFEQSRSRLFALQDAFGQSIANPGLQPVGVATNDIDLSEAAILSRSFSLRVNVRNRRTSGSLTLSNDRRSSSGNNIDDNVSSLAAIVSQRLSRNTSANAGASVELSKPDGAEQDTLVALSLGFSHTLNQDISARVDYRHQRLSSDAPNTAYKENRLSANVSVRF